MKTNIKKFPFDIKKNPNNYTWYAWDEYCDMCGKLIHNTDLHTTQVPDINEKDYCIDCLRELLKEKHT